MSRSLFLLRHGKSDWSSAGAPDHERPLKKRGRRAAEAVGAFLARTDLQPHHVYTSTAVRAASTARLAHESGLWAAEIEERSELYGADPTGLLRIVADADPTWTRVLVVGHEPTMSATVAQLTGGVPVFPTATLARVDLLVSAWSEAPEATGSLSLLLPPRLLEMD